ncbi:transporter [Arcobacter suis]|uniref:RND family efflux system, outer membrane channel protein, TolC family n=1 Tax=Arcobacter suis CECT 7833 TaxID=663365 RepID=A0AAD0WQ25_9BACT|nr:TolC family protein [Arcobacter suis]AXX88993.1 RND family efflux system, outer membrane channel protein, TolC family [Arcobacter suis CECT 7833]RWS47998.1 transporter [Arcobacter suis]
MKRIIIPSLFCSLIFANELDILQKDKKELRQIEKEVIQKKYEGAKDDWIGTINLSSGLTRSHSFSKDNDSFNKSISIGFTQSVYESGGIEFGIKYANDELKSETIAWENENIAMLQTIYETLLTIEKLKLQIEQSDYLLKNKDIELILKKIQYEAGRVDIIELNNAIMSKNNQQKENISLKNSLKDKEYELSKYTSFKSNEIEIIDFKIIDKEKFLKDNLNIRYENSRVELLDTSYKQLKSSYLPKVSLNTNAGYSDNGDLSRDTNEENKNGSVGLNMTMPLFDITKEAKIEKSKLEVLKQKVNVTDIQNELVYEYEQILAQINTYEEYEQITKNNLKLYDDLLMVNQSSNSAGMTSDFDLEILQNTKKINEYDLEINDINKKLQYSKLYFKTKADI